MYITKESIRTIMDVQEIILDDIQKKNSFGIAMLQDVGGNTVQSSHAVDNSEEQNEGNNSNNIINNPYKLCI